ncbi:MAG: ATP-binding cassette domain-containing protein [Crocinitomicaceae bacterium]|nr:ATP-binding cassette domain-containing protein [Crocinitomicaceae bacterium]
MIQAAISKKLGHKKNAFETEFTIHIKTGDFVAIKGKSGSGKTTLLRLLSGLEKPDKGLISSDSEEWYNSETKTFVKTQNRNVGFVFQDYALFPNMTVRQNLEYGNKNEDQKLIKELLEITELDQIQNQYPNTISGGQKQRVALARALVTKPKYLFLDEPLSALDLDLRTKLQEYLIEIHKKYQLTIIMVSHDELEILNLANKVIELEDGKVLQQGSVSEVLQIESGENQKTIQGRILALNPDTREVTFSAFGNIITTPIAKEKFATLQVGQIILIDLDLKKIRVKP